jgi:hypothetical protein
MIGASGESAITSLAYRPAEARLGELLLFERSDGGDPVAGIITCLIPI